MDLDRIITGDVMDGLRSLPDGCVHTCVTSPPYYGLRDYGTAAWEGGEPGCDHKHFLGGHGDASEVQVGSQGTQSYQFRSVCGKCGARRIDSQIGLEASPSAYIERMVEVFREVRRVLRDDGTAWVNMGDSYAGSNGNGRTPQTNVNLTAEHFTPFQNVTGQCPGLKPKDLCGIPWRLAFALQADGWYLRSDIIWAKPNPMPESVTDRPTKAHEYIFLLSKREHYYYDAEAVREASDRPELQESTRRIGAIEQEGTRRQDIGRTGVSYCNPAGRNRRTVWTVATAPFKGAHFATFPPKLIEPCILAGCPAKACPVCGAPWERMVDKEPSVKGGLGPKDVDGRTSRMGHGAGWRDLPVARATDIGFRPTCDHGGEPVGGTVLDPFMGAGTTAVVAKYLGRHWIGCELNPKYVEMAKKRTAAAEYQMPLELDA